MFNRFAVIGNPIEHSLSPVIHQYFAQQFQMSLTYEKIKGDDAHFEKEVFDFFNHGGKGLNVTLPYKQRAFALAKTHSTRCNLAGAANTLLIKENKLYADNTDGIGLIRDLTRIMELQNKNILILGAGGATRGILHPLFQLKPGSITVANRTLEKAEALQNDVPQIQITGFNNLNGVFDLIINATPASLEGNILALPAEMMEQKPFCYDLAYQLKEATPFVRYAHSYGCNAVDGLGMLVEQAAEAFFIWNGIMPSTENVLALLRQH